MDRRSEPRTPIDVPVSVRHLDGGENPTYPGRLIDMSGRGVRVSLEVQLPVSHPIVVEMSDGLLLGEVMYCVPAGELWQVGLEIQERFRYTRELEALRRAVDGEPANLPVESRTKSE